MILIATLGAFCLYSCSLEELPVTSGNKSLVFGSEQGLEAYSLSFYKQLPTLSELTSAEGTSDYGVAKSVSMFYTSAYTAETSTSWGWGNLRTVNYFIDGLHSDLCTVSQAEKDHYEGLARWFRAYFYYNKLFKYGGVPWFDHCLKNDELDEMYKNRDSRDVIISHIIDDLDFAADKIKTTSSKSNTRISKNAAYALKCRACLWEASWRKYHNLETAEWTANKLYREAAAAAKVIINDPLVQLNNKVCADAYLTDNPSLGAYRSLFYSKDIITDEVILGVQASLIDLVTGDANWYWTSPTYGGCPCLSRAFIFTYLCTDGTPFTDKTAYKTINFINEFSGRDARLAQTVKGPRYEIKGGNWRDRRPNIVDGVAITGYQPIKFIEDSTEKNGTSKNENSQPILRYAEVLLNYAEAMAELGELTDADWAATIGALRLRAGFQDKPGVTLSKPTKVDTYLKETFYPDINDPVILEIRRERAIELVYEGFRPDDLKRWKEGKNFERVPWTGIHVPTLNAQFKVNDDDTADFYVTYDDYANVPSYAQNKYVHVYPEDSAEQGLRLDTNPDGGYDLRYEVVVKRKWYDDGRQYLYPIPAEVIREYENHGYKLDQNPGW
ncbi:MAG: RagB/SusD family nutrient uptake outer membrane protein [Bacteroidales bacterium]|nr:RagB/SusD family nutrient uptake outer membrane protein [Bacteroidales bacterium]